LVLGKIPWGSINRFQRQTGAIDLTYDDAAPSLPIANASSLWGCLQISGNNYQNSTT
jgi:hypothetical protein